jgi:hypothetical protein
MEAVSKGDEMSKRTVRDFPQEYFDIWRLAVAGQLKLVFPTRGKATNKKVDLQIFRKRLSEEDPNLANDFFQVDLLVEGDNTFGSLTGYVADWKKQVRDQVAASDFTPAAIAAIATETIEKKQEADSDAVSEILHGLGYTPPVT